MGKARQDRVNGLELTSLNNFRGLWSIGLVSSCLIPGPGMIKIEEYCLRGCTGQIEEVWHWVGYFAYQRHAPSRAFCYL